MQQPSSHRAKVLISINELGSLLDVPDDVVIRAVYAMSDPGGVAVVMESDRFAEVPENAESPIVSGAWRAESVVVGGKRYSRLIAWGEG